MRFTYIDVKFDVKYEGHQNWSKILLCTFCGFLVTIICDIKIDINMCESHYVNFFVNLLHSQDIWFFDNWHLFDNFTSFDILLPHHLCAPLLMGIGVMGHMGNVVCALLDLHGSRVMGCMGNRPLEQWGTWAQGVGWWGTGVIGHMGNVACPLLGLHGSRVMGYMGNRPHEQWGTWAMGHIAIMYRSRWGHGWWGTWAMGHIVNLVNIFTEYVNIYLWDARGEFIMRTFAWK